MPKQKMFSVKPRITATERGTWAMSEAVEKFFNAEMAKHQQEINKWARNMLIYGNPFGLESSGKRAFKRALELIEKK